MLPTYKDYKILKELGKTIRAERKVCELSIKELAGMAKISGVYLNNIELGYENPSVYVLERIAKSLEKVLEIQFVG